MSAMIMEEYKGLFKDEESFLKFVEVFREKLADDFSPVLSNSVVLGAIVSSEAAKDYIYERIVKRIAKSPEILTDIQHRLKNDKVIDIDEI